MTDSASTTAAATTDARRTPFPARRTLAALLRLGYAGLRVALALVAAISYVLPWHKVYETRGGVSPGMIFNPERGSRPVGRSEPVDTGVTWLHNGYSDYDGGVVLPILAVALAMVGVLALRRTGPGRAALIEVMGMGLCAGLAAASCFGWIYHSSCRLVNLGGAYGYYTSIAVLLGLWFAGPVVQLLLMSIRGRVDEA